VHLDYTCEMKDSLLSIVKQPTTLVNQIYQYWRYGDGWFLAPLVEAAIFAKAEYVNEDGTMKKLSEEELDSRKGGNVPDFEIMTGPIADPRFPEFDKKKGTMSLLLTNLRPKSTGKIHLRSLDPLDNPICDMRYLSNPEDREVYRKAIKVCMRIADGMREEGYPLIDVHVPKSWEEGELDAFVEKWSASFFHYTSSCRMGPESGEGKNGEKPGVVDEKLRVHGVKGLRIADASVFPWITSAHPQAGVVMIAERCADFVLKEYVGSV